MVSKTSIEHSPPSVVEDYMTEDELEDYLENLKTKIPSFIVELLKNNLKNRKLTKNQLDKIVNRVTELYLSKRPEDKKTEELVAKIGDLSNKLDALMRVAAISSATRFSETIDNELNEKCETQENSTKQMEKEKEKENEDKYKLKSKEEPKEPKSEEQIHIDVKESKSMELTQDMSSKIKPKSNKKSEYGDEKTKNTTQPPVILESSPVVIETSEHALSNKEDILVENSGVPTMEEVITMQTDLTPVQKTYKLESLPEDTISTMLVFKWIEFLVSRVGPNNLIDILDYYHSLGWISDSVVNRLAKASKNMKYFNEEFRKSMGKMIPEDHVVSLLYIEKLAGRPIPVDELENINREVARIIKWGEEIQSI